MRGAPPRNVSAEVALRLVGIDPKSPNPERQAREAASSDLEMLAKLLELAGQGETALEAHLMLPLADMLQRISDRLATADHLIGLLGSADESDHLDAREAH